VKDTREIKTRSSDNLHSAPIERILRNSAERISEQSIEELKQEIQYLGSEIGTEADSMADHAQRETIKESDVELAIEKFEK